MVKIKQNINKHSITVVSNTRDASVLASTDSSMYYSNLSKEWACKMPASVDGTEYSAKYYMEKTKQEAIDSKTDLQASCSQNISDMNNIKNNTVADLQALCSQNISNMNSIKDNAIAGLQSAGDDILVSVSQVYDRTAAIETELLNLVPTLANVSLSNINNVAKIHMANASMPSSVYIDLTLGANGASYTAPADGYIKIGKTATAVSQYLSLAQAGYTRTMFSTSANAQLWDTMPIAKGTTFNVNYNVAGTTLMFRFYYAQGSESEAQ